MRKMGWLRLGAAMFFAAVCVSEAAAEGEVVDWIKAPLGKIPPIVSYERTQYGKADAEGQDTALKMWDQSAVLMVPVLNQENQDLMLGGTYSQRHLGTSAVLSGSGLSLPDDLYNVLAGGAYRRQFANGWLGGVSMFFGSTSDKLFYSEKELTYRVDIFTKIPVRDRDAWVFYLDCDNNRDFLHIYPVIPGVAYWYKPSEDVDLVIGLPTMYADVKFAGKWEFELFYVLTDDLHAELSYDLTKKLELYCGFDWNSEVFARANRETRGDRLCYYEKTVNMGVHWQALEYAGVDVSAGYAFDRFFYDAKDYDSRGDNRVNFKSAPFVQANVGIPF